MLKIEDLKYADIPNIKVDASDDLFKELGNNTYDFIDLISELIDNSIAASFDDKVLEVNIEIGFSDISKERSYFLIRDNGKGIERDMIGKAISPAALAGGTSLNEHGLGMKQAIASLGELKYLATKNLDDKEAIIVEEFKFGEIFPKVMDVDWLSGTEICINKLKVIVPRSAQTYTKSISYLGARYRRYLKRDNPKMKLNIVLLDIDEKDKNDNSLTIKKWHITEHKPTYFHPNKRVNEPIIKNKSFKGKGWDAEFTFGYAPKDDDEYEEMGLTLPKQYDPYYVSLTKQGFDLIKNDRIIMFHQLSELNLVVAKHNKYNHVRGEINLKKGFTTAITKNNIIYDENFADLISQLKEFLEDNKFLEKRSYPGELPEKLLRDRLATHLKTRTIEPKKNVKTEYPVEGLGGFIDILADREAWELKIGQASGLDIYQLFAYMDMGDIKKGYLIAPDFSTGSESAGDFIKKNHDKEILLVKSEEFPIMDPPTSEEIKKYF